MDPWNWEEQAACLNPRRLFDHFLKRQPDVGNATGRRLFYLAGDIHMESRSVSAGKSMVQARPTIVVILLGSVLSAAALLSADDASPFAATDPVPETPLDKLVFGRLRTVGIEPALPCSDAVFLRRAYLDIIGTLPTAREARDFLADASPSKRGVLVDRLLEREEFADYWAMRWSDILRVKAEFPINLWPNAAQAYHRWIRTSIKQNKPYDLFVAEMLTASGSSFRVAEVNFYRAVQSKDPQTVAQAVALTFMGTRAENWPKERLDGMAAFFSRLGYKTTTEWKEEIVYFDLDKADGPLSGAVFPDGTPAKIAPDQDPRELLAAWLISPKNPWFARNIANRAWSWLVGRGIIHEPDDIRPDNPPSNPELLAYLEQELIASKFDLKHLFRIILNSRTYQLSSVPRGKGAEAVANFAFYPTRRLEAEVLIDAICQITGTTEKYSSPIPEPFTFIPEQNRTIMLPDGSISSSFLEMFGRPPRDTGMESERTNKPTPAQRLHFLNSSHIQRKLEQGGRIQPLLQEEGSVREAVPAIYLTILSRFPTEQELAAVEAYAKTPDLKNRQALQDLVWALVNSMEFQYRH